MLVSGWSVSTANPTSKMLGTLVDAVCFDFSYFVRFHSGAAAALFGASSLQIKALKRCRQLRA